MFLNILVIVYAFQISLNLDISSNTSDISWVSPKRVGAEFLSRSCQHSPWADVRGNGSVLAHMTMQLS